MMNEITCDICGGSGEVEKPVYDNDAHAFAMTGTQPCVCTFEVDEGMAYDEAKERGEL